MKALLLVDTPASARDEVVKSFRGAVAHNLLWLRSRLRTARVVIPASVAKELAYVASWSVDLRYEPGPGDREDAQRFLTSTRIILQWADQRM